MKIEINLDDYISEDEKKKIAKDLFVDFFKEKLEEDYRAILSNAAYDIVFRAVDDEMDGELKHKIKENTIKVVENLSEYSVFSDRETYRGKTKKSIAQEYLDDAITQSKVLIYDKVNQLVNEKLSRLTSEHYADEATLIIENVVSKVIYEKLTG